MSQTATAPLIEAPAATPVETAALARPAIIDCDLHNEIDSLKDLYPYLPQRWRRAPGHVRRAHPQRRLLPALHGPP